MTDSKSIAKPDAERVVLGFLKEMRAALSQAGVDKDRCPRWVQQANIRTTWIMDTLIFVAEDSASSDVVRVDTIQPDVSLFLGMRSFSPKAASLSARKDNTGLIILLGPDPTASTSTIRRLAAPDTALFNCGYAGYHGPLAVANLFIEYAPSDAVSLAVRFIPFALYAHFRDFQDGTELWKLCEPQVMRWLTETAQSQVGNYYANKKAQIDTFTIWKEKGVIVLGSYSLSQPDPLASVRDALRAQGYDAFLIRDLPESPMASNEEKVRLWTVASRFTVMVDTLPGGQLAEYQILKQQRTVLALIRPEGERTSWMIGDDELVDLNYIRTFEFRDSPLNVLPAVIEWAEGFVKQREGAYEKYYPWRER